MSHYILDGHTPVPEPDDAKWATWILTHYEQRIVAKTGDAGIEVSTAFLGIDHGFGDNTPVLFETLVRGGKLDDYLERYYTWDEAAEGHKYIVEKVTLAYLQDDNET